MSPPDVLPPELADPPRRRFLPWLLRTSGWITLAYVARWFAEFGANAVHLVIFLLRRKRVRREMAELIVKRDAPTDNLDGRHERPGTL